MPRRSRRKTKTRISRISQRREWRCRNAAVQIQGSRRSFMTYRFALVVGIGVLLFAAVAQAQSKAELFGGYQYTRPDGGPNLNGWNGALTGNFNQTFGITADFSGSYGSGLNFYTYTFGPKLG